VLFYILGAPLLAALEVIIYAGGIMVLFLFVVMMVKDQQSPVDKTSRIRQWLPAMILAGSSAVMPAPRFRRSRNRMRPRRDGHAAGVQQTAVSGVLVSSKSHPCCFLQP